MGGPTRPMVLAIVKLPAGILTAVMLNIGLVEAADDPAEELSNAFISDLAPLIALFGEQVTKQFMSQSMYWYDHIIFAMAPLGIITAIVGAIRVGGPNFLRAIVGRARESRGAAEVELMSSTSHDVCELWNGSQIVRVMGSSPIKQILFFPSQNELHTLETAVECGLLEKVEEKSYIDRLLNRSSQSTSDPENPEPSQHKTEHWEPFAPNIALNFGWRASRWELRLIAAIGVILQFGVLLTEAFITHYPTLKFTKESPVSSVAFQLTVSGTLVLVLGMLLCSYVIEQSTKEITWKSKDEDSKFYILWVQKGGTVNDQNFESFALFADGQRTSIMTSRPIQAAIDEERRLNMQALQAVADYSKDRYVPEDEQLSNFTETLVMIATGMSLGGFFLQFVGLRGMHWLATVAQIGATLLMTALRAFVRRDLAGKPFAQRLPKDFEIDWLATRLASAAHAESFWGRVANEQEARKTRSRNKAYPKDRNSPETSEGDDSDVIFWGKSCINWDIHSHDSIDVASKRLQQQSSASTETSDIVRIRKRLRELTGWDSPATTTASSLSKATESIMHTFDSSGATFEGSLEGLCWPLDVVVNYKPQTIYLTIRFEKGKWRADSRELEAVLSLWLYSLGLKRPGERKVQVFGRKTVPLIRDYSWWIKDNSNPILEMVVVEDGKNNGNDKRSAKDTELRDCDVFGYGLGNGSSTVDRTRVAGKTLQGSSVALTKQKLQLDSQTLQQYDGSTTPFDSVNLAVATYSSSEETCAKHLFSIFMLAVANTIEKDTMKKVGGHTTLQYNGILDDTHDIKLENTVLAELAQGVHQTGLCSREAATFTVITALSSTGKLPKVDVLVEWAQGKAAHYELTGRYAEAGRIHLWLYQICKTFGWTDKIVVEVTALLHEFSETINNTLNLWEKQKRSEVSYQELVKLKETLHEELTKRTKTGGTENDLMLLKHLSSMLGRLGRAATPSSKKTDDGTIDRATCEQLVGFQMSCFSQLHSFALTGTWYDVREAVDGKVYDLNGVDIMGRTPLHYSVTNSKINAHKTSTSYLLEKAADPNIGDIGGFTPLNYAARCSNKRAVSSLLQGGGDTEARGRDGTTALHCAALIGNIEVTRLLLEAGATVEAQDNGKRTSLHWAAASGRGAVVKALVAREASASITDNYGRIPLHIALLADRQDEEYTDGLRDLLKKDKETALIAKDRDGCTALHLAAKAGNNAGIAVLLDQQADIEIKANDGRTAIHFAAGNGRVETMELLLQEGASLDAGDNLGLLAIHWASREGQTAIVQLLLDHKGVDVNSKDNSSQTPLSWAADKGQEAVVQLLLDNYDVDVNAKSISGMTPLSWPALRGHEAVVRLLLDHKDIIVNTQSSNGQTPLSWAAESGHESIVRLLLGHKDVDVNLKDNEGQTPLSLTAERAERRCEAVVRLLLDNKDLDVNPRNNRGKTPLLWAAEQGDEALVQLLLDHKDVDVNVKDHNGRVPLWWASNKKHEAVVRLLLDHKDVDVNLKDISG